MQPFLYLFSEGQLLQPVHGIGLRNHQVHGPQIDPQSFLSGKISSQGLVEISLLLASLSNYSFNFDISLLNSVYEYFCYQPEVKSFNLRPTCDIKLCFIQCSDDEMIRTLKSLVRNVLQYRFRVLDIIYPKMDIGSGILHTTSERNVLQYLPID